MTDLVGYLNWIRSGGGEERVFSLTTTVQILAGASPYRIGLLVVGNNPGHNVMSIDPNVVFPRGIKIWDDNTAIFLTAAKHGILVQKAWYGISDIAGPSTIMVYEVMAPERL